MSLQAALDDIRALSASDAREYHFPISHKKITTMGLMRAINQVAVTNHLHLDKMVFTNDLHAQVMTISDADGEVALQARSMDGEVWELRLHRKYRKN